MERAKANQAILLNGMSIDELIAFLEINDLNLSQFGHDAPLIDKFRILIGLDRLKRLHAQVVELKQGDCD